ncbi:MAG: AAA family ATPase [bacterium]
MFLQRLEIQGFKSFANKTVLEFPNPNKGQSITAIVGPNGSGKSCMADSIRWVLGEQSLKLLRGKKSTDVIFSGSEKKSRSGFAEASLYLDNSDRRAPIDYAEIAITRRLYQNGENEYFLNKNKARLQDILLILAQANFGQRAYSVIGQGMIDAVLVQTPRERKDFFDEAAGVKQFQIKRHSSVGKLKLTEENLKQVEVLLLEIKPRLNTLSRHVKKLDQYDEMKARLHSLEHLYYGTLWHKIQNDFTKQRGAIDEKNKKLATFNREIAELQKQFEQKESASEKKDNAGDEVLALQSKYTELVNRKNTLREKEFINKEKITSFRLQNETKKEIPQAAISLELDEISHEYQKLINGINDKTNPLHLKEKLEKLLSSIDGLNKKIKNPNSGVKIPEELTTILEAIAKDTQKIDAEIKEIQIKIDGLRAKQKTEQTEFFAVQRQWRDRVEEKNILEGQINELKIELARIETRKDSLETEMETHLKERKEMILQTPPEEVIDPHTIENEMQNLRYQIELVGNIDPETIKEYKETKERYDFLDGQSNDLRNAIKQLREIIKDMDAQIKIQFDTAFKKINSEFGKFFSALFDGGRASLEIVETEKPSLAETSGEEQEYEKEPSEEMEEKIDDTAGIEIFANPPGKKVKSVGMLSGGERALTSIALICAIISNNPSPFVALDEVDAALDESNSIRFAEIIKNLAHKTQFILITHNRATMSTADLLYGVTMGEDSVSKLLSLKLEEAEGLVNR